MSEVLLLDVTAMAGESVCVAGIDLESNATIRLNTPQPTRSLVRNAAIHVTDVVSVDYHPSPTLHSPHVEDVDWTPNSLRGLRRATLEDMGIAFSAASDSVTDALGAQAFNSRSGNAAWAPAVGARSLASVRVRYLRVEERERGKLRAAFRDRAGNFWHGVPFQDLSVRVHGESCAACGDLYEHNAREEFDANGCVVRIGLTRPVQLNEYPAACWLQVTNVLSRPRRHFV